MKTAGGARLRTVVCFYVLLLAIQLVTNVDAKNNATTVVDRHHTRKLRLSTASSGSRGYKKMRRGKKEEKQHLTLGACLQRESSHAISR